MSKPPKSIADQLEALNLKKGSPMLKSHSSKNHEPVADFRHKPALPQVDDLESAMAQKLETSGWVQEEVDPESSDFIKSRLIEGWGPLDVFGAARNGQPNDQSPQSPTFRIAQTSKRSGLTRAAEARLRGNDAKDCSPAANVTVEKLPSAPPEAPTKTALENPPKHLPPTAQAPETAKEIFGRITSLVGAAVPKIEPRPRVVKSADVQLIDDYVTSGAQWLRDNPDRDLDNGYMVGIDFGTSSLKVVVREPYKAGNDVAARPAPEQLRSQEHPYLWQTVVWFDPKSECFSLYPAKGAVALEGFKTGLIGKRANEPIHQNPPISRAEAASAFVALHLCHLFGWIEATNPLERSTAKNFLGINFGVPVATLDDPRSLQPFNEVVLAAIELAKSCQPMTHEIVRDALACVRDESLPEGFALVPELSAALAGYAIDDTKPLGAHILMDVGASTLDIVAFNLVENDDEMQIMAFSASVELLGAAAYELAKASDVKEAEFGQACGFQFHDTFIYACRDDIAPMQFSRSKNPRRADIQLVITGGGCATSVHSALIEKLGGSELLGKRVVDRPEPPEMIASIDCDRSRLLLAYGLAHDEGTFPHPTLPSRITKLPAIKREVPSFIGAEQM